MNERGALVVSNFALFLVTMDAGAPKVVWRTPYERGMKLKPGQIDLGSSTTPTLMGSGFVVIGDGSAPMKELVGESARSTPETRRLGCYARMRMARAAKHDWRVSGGQWLWYHDGECSCSTRATIRCICR